ncbi:MAG: hybrid sensor histidine kinase/response regulator [Herminiimonas sp.]|uniref:hybrid sensor histidine kinase/response regulator n=1 Tax=Herminiimonas sp. TaxID=1926289 RepID=UPI00271F1054|nr:hybrid sensor histidine kinase/response regulator [Herminiimonas sp.]MDO9419725.1 hybrid sensor histidine kinase/response regulator [Herminiimonas sp.]
MRVQQAKILVVDDEVTNIELIADIFDDEYEVIFAMNGEHGLELAATAKPDAILLDVMMPGIDGYEVCRRLKADRKTRNIPVIFITALGDVAAETRGLQLGAMDYVTKPLSTAVVKLRVENQIELKRAREQLTLISHDMRAPQSAILALLELQKDSQTALDLDELFAKIERSAHSTLMLADDFVHLAKAESKIYHFNEADFLDIIADANDDMWALANKKSMTITLRTEEEACWVNVNRRLMVRAVSNLLSNAIKYGPPNSIVSCAVSIDRSKKPALVVYEIRDQGNGIAAADQASLFTPFYRADQPLQQGAGLGLSFVKAVLDQHGGSIVFSNAENGGAIFTMSLPCIDQ